MGRATEDVTNCSLLLFQGMFPGVRHPQVPFCHW